MKSLDGKWSGIAGGPSNIGRVSAQLRQSGGAVSGQFTFEDVMVAPVQADMTGGVSGRTLEGTLSRFASTRTPPVGLVVPSTGKVMGVIEEDGDKISGFWMTNVGTSGGFVLTRA